MSERSPNRDDETLTKQKLRRDMRARVGNMTEDEKTLSSDKIVREVSSLAEFANATRMMFYCALPDELDLFDLIQNAIDDGREVFLPLVVGDGDASPRTPIMHAVPVRDLECDLREGAFGILEPHAGAPLEDTTSLDVIFVPGRAFDKEGHRLGRGKGYYDTFLSGIASCADGGPVVVGVAFDAQLVERVPHDEHDIAMDVVIAPSGVTRVSQS